MQLKSCPAADNETSCLSQRKRKHSWSSALASCSIQSFLWGGDEGNSSGEVAGSVLLTEFLPIPRCNHSCRGGFQREWDGLQNAELRLVSHLVSPL